MGSTTTATLAKWGNSQGLIIPKNICRAADFKVGDTAELTVDECGRIIVTRSEAPRYARRRIVSLEELAAGWQGGRDSEEWGGADVGAEVVV